MADASVTDRRIRPIQAALDTGNWKQAWRECEKWQKKGETSDRFLSLKAAVLIHSPDPKQQERGLNETLQLCRKNPPVVNLEAIDQLQDSLNQLSLGAVEGPKLWERAAGAKPNDEDLIVTWLHDSISRSNWLSAQKATTSLKKAFPKERRYEFWNILMCFLIHEDHSLPEKDRKLFGTLANRMISKAAQSAPSEKTISNSEELSLLAAVLTKTGGVKELVALLQSDDLKTVVDQDQSHANTLLLFALSLVQEQDLVRSYCDETLFANTETSEPSHDDRDWALLSKKLTSPDKCKEFLRLIDKVISKYPTHRQALLAKIDLLTKSEDENMRQDILDTCKKYYDLFGSKAFCFDDLIPRLSNLGLDSLHSLRKTINDDSSSATSPVLRLFILKLDYHLIFRSEFGRSEPAMFADRAIRLTLSSSENQTQIPEAAMLAALALLRGAVNNGDPALILQANMILHTACLKFNDYYPLRILLIQTQIMSGQIHLAMQNFLHLNVKNLQWETIGYLLITRISTLHPHQYGQGKDSCNPLGALDAAISFFVNARKSTNQAIQQGLARQNYSNVIDTVELRSRLERSIVHQICMIEERKCLKARNLGVKPAFELYQGELTDLRDASFMPTYGLHDNHVQSLLQIGPTPVQGWVHANSMHEHLLSYLMAEHTGDHDLCAMTYENLMDVLGKVSAATPDMTGPEQTASVVHRGLCAVIVQLNSKQPSDAKALVDVIAWLGGPSQEAKPAVINEVEYPDWKYLHTQFVRLETLQTIGHFSAVMLNKFKAAAKDKSKPTITAELKSSLQELRKLVDEQVKAVHDQARNMKQKLNASGVLGKLVDVILGRTNPIGDGSGEEQAKLVETIQAFQDEAAVEEYCGAIKESWEDALDGVLATKVKTI